MKIMVLTKKQELEMQRITKFFLEATEPIEDAGIKGMVTAKILSRIACFTDLLLKIPEYKIKWKKY